MNDAKVRTRCRRCGRIGAQKSMKDCKSLDFGYFWRKVNASVSGVCKNERACLVRRRRKDHRAQANA